MTSRIHILDIRPTVEGGHRPAKATVGEAVEIRATLLCDPQDAVAARVVLRDPKGRGSRRAPMRARPGEHWSAEITPTAEGDWVFTVEAWSDPVVRWRRLAGRTLPAEDDVPRLLEDGADLHERAAAGVPRREGREPVLDAAAALRDVARPPMARLAAALSSEVVGTLARYPLRELLTVSRPLPLRVERQRALFGSWYQLFPRSEGAVVDPLGQQPAQPGTLRTALERLPAIAAMGFDVVHLPPVHPIGRTGRRGPAGPAAADDPGSPWAVGSAEGGHDALHPELGTMADFDAFVAAAKELRMEVALDFTLRCSPDHPWVERHLAWFDRPRTEQPPETYEPVFDRDPAGLTREALRVLRHWMRHGVRIFRIADPAGRPVAFWEDVLGSVHRSDPDVIFVAGPDTHPALRAALSRGGFQQCALPLPDWTDRRELTERLTELTGRPAAYLRPQLYASGPERVDAVLRDGGRPAFLARAVLGALLSPTWGIPAGYELCENLTTKPGSKEPLDCELYCYRPRDWAGAGREGLSIAPVLTTLNQLRRRHPALQQLRTLRFHDCTTPDVLVFSKRARLGSTDALGAAGDDLVIVAVGLDPRQAVQATLALTPAEFGLARGTGTGDDVRLHDELSGAEYPWGRTTSIVLDPAAVPACVLTVRRG